MQVNLPTIKDLFTADLRQVDWRRTGLLIVIILMAAALLKAYLMPEVREINTTMFRRVPEIRETVRIERQHVACPEAGLVVLNKQQVTEKLGIDFVPGGDIATSKLPEEVRSLQPEGTQAEAVTPNPSPALPLTREGDVEPDDIQITATADLPESDNGYQEISVVNLRTGESHIEAREKEAPWFRFQNGGAFGVRYGVNQHLTNIGTVYGVWDFLRMKSIWFSASGTLETGGDAKVQLGAEYRW